VEARALMLTPQDVSSFISPRRRLWLAADIERDFADQSLGAGRLTFWFDAGQLITARRIPCARWSS